jgi:hypothetical protein
MMLLYCVYSEMYIMLSSVTVEQSRIEYGRAGTAVACAL